METFMAKSKAAKKSGRRYVLELSERQAQALSQAAELYARLGMGQFDQLDRFFWKPQESLDQARAHLDALRMIKNGSLNAHPGIYSPDVDDDCRVLYGLHQVIRHRLAWDRDPHPGILRGVSYDKPLKTSKNEPLAGIEELEALL
jgi:hypothetical protein